MIQVNSLLVILIPCFVSLICTWIIIKTQQWHAHLSLDEHQGIQKFHHHPTPRIAGVSLFIGFLALIGVSNHDRSYSFTVLLSGLPALGCGLWEDLSKRVSAKVRLVLTLCSGLLIGYLLDIRVTRTGIEWVNLILQDHILLSVFITTLFIAGLSNATNIIDGFNGLMLGVTLLACATLTYIALQVNDYTVARLCAGFFGIVLGVFVFNFPLGKIFSGDGGAYFIGFFLATMGLLLTRRNEEVSPMILGSVFIYPLFETVFSMYRRKVKGKAVTKPDGLHLHTLLFRRFCQKLPFKHPTLTNASVSPLLWLIASLPMILTLFFWFSHWILAIVILCFMVCYVLLFRALINFKAGFFLTLLRTCKHYLIEKK
jgi:UDP-N-acetylmuramyl pentapeptide phosphotransferase/UDP-N-acetylglucosamine-1-phosphate transferase